MTAPTTESVTFDVFAAYQDNPRQSKLRTNRQSKKPHNKVWGATHFKVAVAELPDGTRIKLDGHSRTMAVEKKLCDKPTEKLSLDVYKVQDIEEAMDLFNQFDNSNAVETKADIFDAAKQVAGIEQSKDQFSKGTGATAYKFIMGGKVLKRDDLENAILVTAGSMHVIDSLGLTKDVELEKSMKEDETFLKWATRFNQCVRWVMVETLNALQTSTDVKAWRDFWHNYAKNGGIETLENLFIDGVGGEKNYKAYSAKFTKEFDKWLNKSYDLTDVDTAQGEYVLKLVEYSHLYTKLNAIGENSNVLEQDAKKELDEAKEKVEKVQAIRAQEEADEAEKEWNDFIQNAKPTVDAALATHAEVFAFDEEVYQLVAKTAGVDAQDVEKYILQTEASELISILDAQGTLSKSAKFEIMKEMVNA